MSAPASVLQQESSAIDEPALWPRAGAGRMTWALLGGVAGVALQLQQAALWPWSAYAALLGAGLLAAAGLAWPAWVPGRRQGMALPLVAMALAFGLCGLRATVFLDHALQPALEGRDLQVTGVIAAMPQARETGLRLRLAVESARSDGAPVRLPPLVDLAWYAGAAGDAAQADPPPAVHAGERWRLTVRLKAPHGARNPHGCDYELWLWEQGVQATGYVRSSARLDALHGPPERLAATWRYPVEQLRERVRDAVLRGVDSAADGAQQRAIGVVAALVTGDQRAIERADWDVFRATGVAHLMSISGLHITLFAWLAAALLGRAWRRSARLCLMLPAPTAALVGGVLLAGAYALFSGWGVPAQRTVVMLATVALLRLSGRRWPWPQVWLLACAVVLLADPWALLQPGFWLSFVAVAMLFITGDEQAPPAPHWRARVWHAIRAFLHQQWVVVLALTPLAMLMFGQFSIAGVLANMLAVPLVTVLVTPLALLGVLLPPLWLLAADLLQLLNAMLEWMAAWPWAMHAAALAPLWVGVAGLAGGLLLAVRLPLPWRLQGLVWLAPVLLWQSVRPAPGEFELLMVDIGQGGAVLVRTASHSLLYDTGARHSDRSDAGQRILVPLLAALDEQIDRLVLSHADNDHAGGASAVLQAQPQATVMGSLPPGHVLHTSPGVAACQSGQHWTWDGVRFDVLHPAPGTPLTADNTNASSCVLRIGNGRRSALLAGDIELEQEQQLVQRLGPEQLQADVLLAAHHGSGTSTGADWLQAVQPRWTLIQHGYRNNYGHPHVPVLQRLLEQGSTIVQTDQCGAGWWRSDSNQVRCERERNRRYWQHDVPLAPVRLQDPADRPG